MKILIAAIIVLFLVAPLVAALASCKPRTTADVIWRGTPGPLTCSDDHRPGETDAFTCVGHGRVYTCIRTWEVGTFAYDCAPLVPLPPEAT